MSSTPTSKTPLLSLPSGHIPAVKDHPQAIDENPHTLHVEKGSSMPKSCDICKVILRAQNSQLNHAKKFSKPQDTSSASGPSKAPMRSLNQNAIGTKSCPINCEWFREAQNWEQSIEAESIAHEKAFRQMAEIIEIAAKIERSRHIYKEKLSALQERYSTQQRVVNKNLSMLSARYDLKMKAQAATLLHEKKESLEALTANFEMKLLHMKKEFDEKYQKRDLFYEEKVQNMKKEQDKERILYGGLQMKSESSEDRFKALLKENREQHRKQLENAQSKVSAAEARAMQMEDRNRALQKKNEECANEIDDHIKNIKMREHKGGLGNEAVLEGQNCRETESKELKSAKESFAAERADLLERLEKASKEFTKIEERCESVLEAYRKSEKTNKAIQEERENLLHRLDVTSKALIKAEEMYDTATSQCQALSNNHTIEISCLRKVIDGKSAEIASLKADNASLKAERDSMLRYAAKYNHEYDKVVKKLEVAGHQHQNSQHRITALARKCQEFEKVSDDFEKQSQEYKVAIATKVAENSRLTAEITRLKTEHQKTLSSIKQENDAYTASWNSYVDRIRIEHKIRQNEDSNTFASVKAELDSFKLQLAQEASAHCLTTVAFDELTTTCINLEEEIQNLVSSLAKEVQKTLRLTDLLQLAEARNRELELDIMAQEEENVMDYQRTVIEMAQEYLESQKWFGVEVLDDDSTTVCEEDSECEDIEDDSSDQNHEETDVESEIEEVVSVAEQKDSYAFDDTCEDIDCECQARELIIVEISDDEDQLQPAKEDLMGFEEVHLDSDDASNVTKFEALVDSNSEKTS